jgi:predicted O-methyltransferase YrrM
MTITWKDVPGWFSWPAIYDDAIARAPQSGALFVDVGVFCGRSVIYLAQKAMEAGKDIRIDAVYDYSRSFGLTPDATRAFFEVCGVTDKITLRTGRPAAQATAYADDSIDMLYLDCDHSYEAMVAVISAFLPKVKSGGVIAGDDYTDKWPGVIRAVTELLPNAQVIDCTDGLTPETKGTTFRWVKP